MIKQKFQKNNRGFTLLFAVLVSVLVLAVGASMITIAVKQVILSGSGRESQFAFYAANTGIECALYWDLNGIDIVNVNGVSEIHYVFPPPGEERLDGLSDVVCGGTNIASGVSNPDLGIDYLTATNGWVIDGDSTTFRLAVTNDINADTENIQYCAEVRVEKESFLVNGESTVVTTITSQGLNTCDPENTQRAVQRGLVLQYES